MRIETEGSDLIDLDSLVQSVRNSKWIILFLLFAAVVIAFLYGASQPPLYRAYAVVMASEQTGPGDAGSLTSQLSGLAGLRGGSVDPLTVALKTMTSRRFIIDFIESQKIEREVLLGVAWSEEGGWQYTAEDLKNVAPIQLYERFMSDNFSYDRDRETGLVTLSVVTLSPSASTHWLEQIIIALNRSMQEHDLKQSLQNIEFIQEKLRETELFEMETALYELMQQETRKSMLASGQTEYALRIIDPPFAPDGAMRIHQFKLYVFSIFLALALGITLAIRRNQR